MKHRLTLLIFTVFVCKLGLYAQDIHFSQFNETPLLINPALTGNFDEHIQFTINNRNQWASVTTPYKTMGLSAQVKLHSFLTRGTLKGRLLVNNVSLGFILMQDKAGDSEFKTSETGLAASYTKELPFNTNHSITAGARFTFLTRSINYTNLTFDNQYVGGIFDPNAGTNENYINDRLSHPNLSLGFLWIYQKKNNPFKIESGIGLMHLNKGNESFYNQADVERNKKLNWHTKIVVKLNDNYDLLPGFLWSKEASQNEKTVGATIRFRYGTTVKIDNPTEKTPPDKINIYAGSWFRLGDAIILNTGVEVKKLYIGLSYDLNVSKLAVASNARGGFEIAIRYKYTIKQPDRNTPEYMHQKDIPCPSYL